MELVMLILIIWAGLAAIITFMTFVSKRLKKINKYWEIFKYVTFLLVGYVLGVGILNG